MTDKEKQEEILAILKDVAELLKAKGMADKEINDAILKLVTEVEMATVEELITKLSPEKRTLLEEMSKQNKSTDEIAAEIKLDPTLANDIEIRKFKQLVGQFVASIDEQK